MRIITVLEADLHGTPFGTRSRLRDDLRGQPTLRRTIEQVARAKGLDDLWITCPTWQADECATLVRGTAARIHPHDNPPPPYRALMITARKFSLDGWRGGIGGACVWDEYTTCGTLAALAERESADAVWTAPAASPLIDPEIITEMAAHFRANHAGMRLVFAQAPPGLVGTIYETGLLKELVEKRTAPSWILTYKPDFPAMDLAFKECCLPTPQPVRHAAGRLVVDTDRSWDRVSSFLTDHADFDAPILGQWLTEHERQIPALPREVEIELTTEDQLSGSVLHPRGSKVGPRGPMHLETVRALVEELATVDDMRVVLGGFGEPLLHPDFTEIIALLAADNLFAVAIQTNGLALDDGIIQAVLDAHVDVVCITLDAATPDTYRHVQGADRWDEALAGLQRLQAARQARRQVSPLIVAQLTKSRETYPEMEAFVDGWLRRGVWPVVTGQSHYARQCPDHAVMSMAPPVRGPCRRIQQRAMVLADGTVTACDQDFAGLHPMGRLPDQSLGKIWRSPQFHQVRSRHEEGHFDGIPLCAACEEWHRP